MAETEPYDIDLSRVIDAPPTRVYEAFTDPDQFATWYGPIGFPVDEGERRARRPCRRAPSVRDGRGG